VLGASARVDLFDLETGRPYVDGIAMLPRSCVRLNAVAARRADHRGRRRFAPRAALAGERSLRESSTRGWAPGPPHRRREAGGHRGRHHRSIYGAIAAHACAYPGMGILHLDAHDLAMRTRLHGAHPSILQRRPPATEVSRLVRVGLATSRGGARAGRVLGGRVVLHTDPG
jgi:agmatinase